MANKLEVNSRTAMTGSEIEIDLSGNYKSFMFQAIGGNVELRTTSGSTEYYTILEGGSLIQDNLSYDQSYFVKGSSGTYLEIITIKAV